MLISLASLRDSVSFGAYPALTCGASQITSLRDYHLQFAESVEGMSRDKNSISEAGRIDPTTLVAQRRQIAQHVSAAAPASHD